MEPAGHPVDGHVQRGGVPRRPPVSVRPAHHWRENQRPQSLTRLYAELEAQELIVRTRSDGETENFRGNRMASRSVGGDL